VLKASPNVINRMSTAINPKRLHESLLCNFKLWIKFKDGNCVTFTAYSMATSEKQYLAGNRRVGVDYYKGMMGLLKMVDVTYKDKYYEARIYTKHSKKEKDNILVGKWVNGHMVESNPVRYDFCNVYYNRADFDTSNNISR
jgi:hypothetical protein